MSYSLVEFLELIEAVEAQGGERLDKLHEVRIITVDTGATPQRVKTTHCDEVALFNIPYESFIDGRPRTVEVCGVDDMVGHWPRFKRAKA